MTGLGRPGEEEREVKLAVGDDYELPPWDDVAGATVVDRGDVRLRAVYWDSDDLALCRAGVGLRHRNGVWTYKGESRRDGDAVVREEIEHHGAPDTIPSDMRERLRRCVDVAALHPVAELDTVRHQVDVADPTGTAEVVHDRVAVLDGGGVVSGFAEVEVEFAEASQALADRLVRLLVAGGAVVHTTPKYIRALRALGLDPPGVSP